MQRYSPGILVLWWTLMGMALAAEPPPLQPGRDGTRGTPLLCPVLSVPATAQKDGAMGPLPQPSSRLRRIVHALHSDVGGTSRSLRSPLISTDGSGSRRTAVGTCRSGASALGRSSGHDVLGAGRHPQPSRVTHRLSPGHTAIKDTACLESPYANPRCWTSMPSTTSTSSSASMRNSGSTSQKATTGSAQRWRMSSVTSLSAYVDATAAGTRRVSWIQRRDHRAAEQRRRMDEPRRTELAHQSTTYEVAIRPGRATLDNACRGGGAADMRGTEDARRAQNHAASPTEVNHG